ncbi:nucleotidyl transferase AbiEii/AbiGii toxin family protein, partial [Patescibacteria group bacterium]|nr:nucleotidyl transferase AbiEii/AbiGii toxin family protein [Patescibacteria group bacterium]
VTHAQNMKVEINLRGFGSTYEVKSYLGMSMKVMVEEDMVAHKFVAMFERIGRTNRDIYDIWFFLNKGWPVNTKIVEARTGVRWREFLKQCVLALEKMPNRGILSGMGEFLDAKQKDWVKLKLR